MKYALIAVIVLMSWGQPTAAAAMMDYSRGNDGCKIWIWASKKKGYEYWMRQQWVTGYIEGYLLAGWQYGPRSPNADSLFQDLSWFRLSSYIDKNCQENPTSNILGAARELAKVLLSEYPLRR